MRNFIIIIFLTFFSIHIFSISLSVISQYNTYVQVYDALGALIVNDFIYPDKKIEVNSGAVQLDRIRFFGFDRKVYEYHFDKRDIFDKVIFQCNKNNTFSFEKIESGGKIKSLLPNFQANVLYE